MTKEEAIKELTELLPEEFLSEYADAIKMGIEALEQEPCGDCVSREAVENAIKHAEVNFTVNSDIDFTKHIREVHEIVNGIVDAQIKALRDLPSVTPQPKMGRWIDVDGIWFKCSECDAHRKMMPAYKEYYCPNCGCRMQEVQDADSD